MRAYTLRNAVSFGTIAAVSAGLVLVSNPAHADVGSGAGYSSLGAAELKYEHHDSIETGIGTGWVGPAAAQVNIGITFDPVKGEGPLFSVEMHRALVEASWGNDQKIILKAANGVHTDGIVKVRHSLSPSVGLKLNLLGLNATFSYSANELLNYLPGSKFYYDSRAEQPFAPWAFSGVDTKLSSPNLDSSKLFEMDMKHLPDLVSNNVKGFLGIRAITKPTFTYKTTKIMLSGTDGDIQNGSDELTAPMHNGDYGDYMEVMASVQGAMTIAGSVSIKPFVHIDQIGESQWSTEFDFDVYEHDYTGKVPETKINFATALVHIPLPNVRVPRNGVDLGMVKVGGTATKRVLIENTGEMDASMTFSSSDVQFTVPNGMVMVPAKSSYELEVSFSPEVGEAALAEITVSSNDPDSPTQSFKIGANGADVGPDAEGPDDDLLPDGGADADSGCGCKAAGASPVPGWAGLGLGGLGALIFFRRRRRAS